MGSPCGTGGGGSGGGASGGGGSGGCGGEDIGVAVEADQGCCCVVPATGDPGQCTTVDDPSLCSLYNSYTPGACNGIGGTVGGCSASRIGSGAGGGEEVFVLSLALAAFCAMLRRFAWRSAPDRSQRGARF